MAESAQDLITAAYRKARVLGADQVLSAARAALGLTEINALLDDLWTDGAGPFHIKAESFPLVAGQVSYTIGVGGNFNTTRPIKLLEGAQILRNGVYLAVAVIQDRAQFDNWAIKTVQGPVECIYYDADFPLGKIFTRPLSDQADSLYLYSPAQLQNLAALITAVSLPPGYRTLIVSGLAMRLAPYSGLEVMPSVKREYYASLRRAKNLNASIPVLGFDSAILPRGLTYDITSGMPR